MQSAKRHAVLRVLVDWQAAASSARLRKYRLLFILYLAEIFALSRFLPIVSNIRIVPQLTVTHVSTEINISQNIYDTMQYSRCSTMWIIITILARIVISKYTRFQYQKIYLYKKACVYVK